MELLTQVEGELALSHARHVLHEHVARETYIEPEFSQIFSRKRGVFVTLTKKGHLRGCIGFPQAVMPLRDAIREAACSAATDDPRFPAVSPKELPYICVEVTVLTEPVVLDAAPEGQYRWGTGCVPHRSQRENQAIAHLSPVGYP